MPSDDPDLREFHNYAPWINVVCGLLVFVLRYAVLRYAAPSGTFSVHWNLFLTGLVIMFAALAATIAHGNTSRNYWSTLNVAAGVWLLVSARIVPSTEFVTSAQEGLGALVIAVALASLVIELISQRHIAKDANGGPHRR